MLSAGSDAASTGASGASGGIGACAGGVRRALRSRAFAQGAFHPAASARLKIAPTSALASLKPPQRLAVSSGPAYFGLREDHAFYTM